MTAAVLHHLTVIGEAINRLPSDLRNRHPEVPWLLIIGIRHRIVHAYFDLDWQILWDAAITDVPELQGQIRSILRSEFPEGREPMV
ncbi:MAG TPA: HepT-like ribonuclease domain-containing protein [Bryobacteraceae bacterium]|nr:HepT-like ribonuclease domain-containing protein [Bryobacteraceae bacterium]